jgi:hypothetical protein
MNMLDMHKMWMLFDPRRALVLAAIGVAVPDGSGQAQLAQMADSFKTREVFGNGVDGDPVEERELEIPGGELDDVRDGAGGAVEADAAAVEKGPFGDGTIRRGGGERGERGEQQEQKPHRARHDQTISVIL